MRAYPPVTRPPSPTYASSSAGDHRIVWDLACALAVSGHCPPAQAVLAAARMRAEFLALGDDLDPARLTTGICNSKVAACPPSEQCGGRR